MSLFQKPNKQKHSEDFFPLVKMQKVHTFLAFFFLREISLGSPGYPRTHHDQLTSELSILPASVSQILRLKACTTTPNLYFLSFFLRFFYVCGHFACVCVCTLCLCSARGGQKKAPEPPQLELQAVSCEEGSGNWSSGRATSSLSH